MGFYAIEKLGGFIMWVVKGFKGKFRKYHTHWLAFFVGFGFIMLIVLLMFLFFG